MTTIKWIDLRDTSTNARLKVTTQAGSDGRVRTYLFVVGMKNTSERWNKAIDQLGFMPSPNNKYLVRMVKEGERINARMFAPVWPNATLAEMQRSDVVLDLKAGRKEREDRSVRSKEEAAVAAEVGQVIRLGRNSDGDEVFLSPVGRFIRNEKGTVQEGESLLPAPLFLRVRQDADISTCADGFIQSIVHGEVQHSEDFDRFLLAVTDHQAPYSGAEIDRAVTEIEAAALRFLERMYDTAQDAYGESARLYEYMPPFRGRERGKGAMPLPLSVMAQRLLGDTSDKVVLYPNAWDGASFAFLPQGTKIRAFKGGKDLSSIGSARQDVEWADSFDPAREQAADAIFINMDPGPTANGTRSDYSQALNSLRILNHNGRAVLVLAADASEAPGEIGPVSRGFYDALSRRYQIEAAFEIGQSLTDRVGTHRALRVVALRNRPPADDAPLLVDFPVKFSWDEVKSYVDEAIVMMDLKEAETQSIDVERVARENEFQRPYIAYSKVGEARTMVPKNLQAPLQAALSRLEQAEGPIDDFVARELGYGANTLGDRFSPEQVDAIGLSVFRMKTGRSPIIADETGIGKGRTLSALATWANKQGKNVIFITDRANLFSDLARDLRDIQEWGRFRPLVMNADGVIIDLFSGDIIHEGTPPSQMRAIIEQDRSLQDLGVNLVMTTYSQIAGEDSPKADWLLNQAESSLVIVDEAHVAAGSDSNMSRVVIDLVTRAWACAYSSATWAKSSENMHIYARAFPEAINAASLSKTMKTGGEAFAEVFSAMMARDGGLIRREHDLSKLEFVVETDTTRTDRNNRIADQIAEVLGAMTYVGGEIGRLLMKANNDTLAALRSAREARKEVAAAVVASRREARRREQQDPGAAAETVAQGVMFRSSFGAGTVLYQVMRRLLALLNTDNVVDLSLQAINEGRKPVIVFEETGESFVNEILAEYALPGIDGERAIMPSEIPVPTVRDMLMKVVSRMGVAVKRKVDETHLATREEAQETEIDVEDVLRNSAEAQEDAVRIEDIPGLDEETKKRYLEGMKRIVDMINKLPPLPLNAVDLVRARLQDAGLRVGEISGRRIALDAPEAFRSASIDSDWSAAPNWKVTLRKKSKQDLNKTVYGFNHGEIDALLINRSAAAGISLHASPRFSDRRRRELIELQIPENPTDRIQLYGRVNRYDQIVGPRIVVASTGVYGETRQLMMQNKKLAKLSANIRSSRENMAEIKHVVDLLNPVGEHVCRKFLEDNGAIRQRLGITDEDLENKSLSIASRMTSRLVLLRVAEQKMVYEDLYEAFAEEVMRLDLIGENPLRAKELDIRARVVQERIAIGVDMEGLGSAFDGPVYLKELTWKENLSPLKWADVAAMVRQSQDKLLAQPGVVRMEAFDSASIEYADISEIDWDNDVWMVGREANEQARLFLEQRAKELEARSFVLPALTPVSSAIRDHWGEAPSSPLATLPTMALKASEIEALAQSYRRHTGIFQDLDASGLIDRLARILDAKSRLDLAGSKFRDLRDALAAPGHNNIKKSWAKKLWVERYLKDLLPGHIITVDEERNSQSSVAHLAQKTGVITALIPPAAGKEANLQKWKIEWVSPGDERPRSVSLAHLLKDVSIDHADMRHLGDPADLPLIGGPVLSGFAFNGINSRAKSLQDFVDNAMRGQRTRKGFVLDGNLYLASEWAQATKNGHGVIYTDERGLRHRAVMLKDRIFGGDVDVFNHLPVRLWNKTMLANFVSRLWSEDVPTNIDGGYLIPTDFASAMNQVRDGEKSELLVLPGKGIAVTMDRKDMMRVSRALRSEVKAMILREHPDFKTKSEDERKEIEASMPKISTSAKRGKKPFVSIEAASVEQARSAIELLSKAVGMEVYLWPGSRIGQIANEVMTEYFTARREDARRVREEYARIRQERESAAQAAQGDASAEDELPQEQGVAHPNQRMAA